MYVCMYVCELYVCMYERFNVWRIVSTKAVGAVGAQAAFSPSSAAGSLF